MRMPERYLIYLLPLGSDFFRYARISNPPANVIDKALVIQRSLLCDDQLGTLFARVDTASLQLAVPELPLKLAAAHVHLKNICCF